MEQMEMSEIIEDISQAEVIDFGKKDLLAYNRLMSGIDKGFTKASDAFITIACNLWQIHHNEYYRIDSYKNIAEFALDKYELKKSATHNYIKVVEKFGNITGEKVSGLREEFKTFSCSQLVHMLTFTPEQIEQVTPDWTIKEIDALGKTPRLIDMTEDEEDIEDSAVSDAAEDVQAEPDAVMNTPELETGRTILLYCDSLDELIAERERLENAYNDMCKDKNFKKKKIRFVLELAFD